MNSYERLRAMVEGRPVDRPGATIWKHFFLEDRVVEDSVKKHTAFQEQNQWDLIKIMSNGVYFQEQYGADITWSRHQNDFPSTNKRIVNSPRGFRDLKPVDVKTGAVAREVEVAKRLVDKYHGKVPVLATVFTPATYAMELYNGWQNPWPFADLIRYYGDDLEAGLKVITEVTRNIIEEFVKAGVDGIFYSSQFMNDKLFTPELYRRFGVPYDLAAFEPAVGKTWFNMMHVHGQTNLFMEFAAQYPLEAVNWEDIITNVSLKEGAERMPDKVVVGGVERWQDFRVEDREQLLKNMIARVKAASESVPSGKLIIASGCAQGSDIPEYRFNTLKEAMDLIFGPDR